MRRLCCRDFKPMKRTGTNLECARGYSFGGCRGETGGATASHCRGTACTAAAMHHVVHRFPRTGTAPAHWGQISTSIRMSFSYIISQKACRIIFNHVLEMIFSVSLQEQTKSIS